MDVCVGTNCLQGQWIRSFIQVAVYTATPIGRQDDATGEDVPGVSCIAATPKRQLIPFKCHKMVGFLLS